ncbi:hypothetical protein BJV82DRAFT_619668 [Fennellomyces sp. T-0311]|nr:hypothetical protein BJV82DRAFT_619668 [Fennellomyces sp. T-0311]
MDIDAKIRKQVEFYFSDSNFPFDKYLYLLSKKNSEGWIPLSTIASFKKMKMLTEDQEKVVAALRAEKSDLFELNEAGNEIRRTKPLLEQNFVERSIYAKGFPLVDEGAEKPLDELMTLQDQIEEFFTEHGKVLAVRLRKTDKTQEAPSKFKGSVFVEFADVPTAEAVVRKDLKFNDKELILKTKRAYLDEKTEKYKNQPRNNNRNKKFNAFVFEREQGMNRKRKNNDNNKNGNKKQKGNKYEQQKNSEEAYEGANPRLLKFRNADDLDDAALRELVGNDQIESLTKREDGTGYILLSSGDARAKATSLWKNSAKVRFFRATGAETKEFDGEAVAGDKAKAENEDQ